MKESKYLMTQLKWRKWRNTISKKQKYQKPMCEADNGVINESSGEMAYNLNVAIWRISVNKWPQ